VIGEPRGHGEDLEDLDADEYFALADGVGEMAGVAGEEQKRDDEDGSGERQIEAARAGIGGHVDGAHGDGDLVDVVVERTEELRPEEGLEAGVFQEGLESVRHDMGNGTVLAKRKWFGINAFSLGITA